jgi:hypothetical protein
MKHKIPPFIPVSRRFPCGHIFTEGLQSKAIRGGAKRQIGNGALREGDENTGWMPNITFSDSGKQH